MKSHVMVSMPADATPPGAQGRPTVSPGRTSPCRRPVRPAAGRCARVALALATALVAIGSGCGREGAGPRGGGGFGGGMPPTPVEVVQVEAGTLADRFEAVGTFQAGDAITVVSEIDGTLERLVFTEGQSVEKGMLLAQLDDDQLLAEARRAEALRDQTQATWERIKNVVDQGAGAPQDLDDAAAGLKVAEANVAVAEARLAKTRVTAPFSGVVGARRVSPGTFLRAGQPITTLVRISQLRVEFSAPERNVPRLKAGAPVTVGSPAYAGYAVEGRILVVDPVLDAETRSARIVALVDNPERRFRPGMSADISAVLDKRENALTVPNEAVFVEGSQSLVYVIKADSTVSRRSLTLGIRLAGAVEVTAGLDPGELVVRAGHQKLYEGARVMPVLSRGGPVGGQPASSGEDAPGSGGAGEAMSETEAAGADSGAAGEGR